MQQVKHFTNENERIFASVIVDTEHQLLSCLWCSEALAPGQVEDVTDYCAKSIQELDIQYWLNDVTQLHNQYQMHSAEAQKSALDYLSSANLKKFALVSMREANPSRSALLHAVKQCGVEVRTFKSSVLACEWLLVPNIEDDTWDQCQALSY